MSDRHTDTRERGQVFASPVRRLSVEEIDLVGGGEFYYENNFGTKDCGGVDNHSKEM
ncbi:MAG TPA: hypothetical protein VFZ91_01760 [Allosphingosinicella sp.]